MEKARQAVEDVDKTLRATGPQNAAQEEDSPDCAACFCPIDPGDLYRLEACAHPFCNGCIVRQVWQCSEQGLSVLFNGNLQLDLSVPGSLL